MIQLPSFFDASSGIQAFDKSVYTPEDIQYCQQVQDLYEDYLRENERYEQFDSQEELQTYGEQHLHDYYNHCYLSDSLQPNSSLPHEEPWTQGPPDYAHYTEMELPVADLPHDVSTDENDKNKTDMVYIPPEGPSSSPIIKEFVAMILGKEGDWLKKITEETGVHYIWYNDNPAEKEIAPAWGSFQIWGSAECLPEAQRRLQYQINHVLYKIYHRYNQ